MSLGGIDANLSWVKSNIVAVLTQPYQTEAEAIAKISDALRSKHPNYPSSIPWSTRCNASEIFAMASASVWYGWVRTATMFDLTTINWRQFRRATWTNHRVVG